MKYKAIIETDEFENFEFFEDGNGKYMVGHDAGATASGGWIPLHFTECNQESILDKIRAEIEQFAKNPDFGDLSLGASCGAMKAIEIINKYKRSEGEK